MRILPTEGKWYVYQLGLSSTGGSRFGTLPLAGPFDTEAEGHAAAGAIEAEHRSYHAQTEVWQCPAPETDTVPFVPLSTAATPAAQS